MLEVGMIEAALGEALARLDKLLSWVCDAEEARSERLRAESQTGWESVRGTLRAPASELLFSSDAPESPLVPGVGLPAFYRARRAFRLDPVEQEVLLLLLAPYLEPRYQRLFAILQDDTAQGNALERLLLLVLGRTPARARTLLASLGESGRLNGCGLIQLAAGPFAAMGRYVDLAADTHDALLELPAPSSIHGIALEWSSERPTAADGDGIQGLFAVVHGPGERLDRAERMADERNAPLLTVRCSKSPGDAAALRAAWRLAALRGALPAFDLSGAEAGAALAAGEQLSRLVRVYGGSALLLHEEPLPLVAPHEEAQANSFAERRRFWLTEAARRGVTLSESEAGQLATNHRLGRRGVADVFASIGSAEPAARALASAAARLCSTPIRHGRAIATRRSFDDLVVSETTHAALDRLVYYVQSRDRVAEARNLEQRFQMQRGPIALFSGRSGTGKTLAAEIIAGAVGRPLHVIDLSRLVSKYIGETEKHIDEVLSSAERAGAVLFFDEADSMFSARTDVSTSNDRFANLEVGFLLQRIERHDGLVILATNLQHVIDEAFLRRFHSRIEFSFPEPRERLEIWRLMLPAELPRAEPLDLEALAQRHRLAGGDIRNAALKAIFLAEQEGALLGQAHLERAVALELYELGRLSRRDQNEDAGVWLRRISESLQEVLEGELRRRFFKEVHVVHGSPTKEALAGRRPAVSLALFRMAATAGSAALRLGYIVSAWSQRPEEEHELLGVVHSVLMSRAPYALLTRRVSTRVHESYDFDLLHRFWSSHGHPIRASVVMDVEIAGN
jgi:AAA+ superfamily predicted ATPase